jgi:hypothetical protein
LSFNNLKKNISRLFASLPVVADNFGMTGGAVCKLDTHLLEQQ